MSAISFRQSFRIGQRVWAKFVKLNKNNMLSEYYKECLRGGAWDWNGTTLQLTALPTMSEGEEAPPCISSLRSGVGRRGIIEEEVPRKEGARKAGLACSREIIIHYRKIHTLDVYWRNRRKGGADEGTLQAATRQLVRRSLSALRRH